MTKATKKKPVKKKDPHAVAMVRKRNKKLSAARRSEIASAAARAKHAKWAAENGGGK